MPMKIEELLKSKRQEILAIAARHGARNVRVFGSVARGEARPESDLDILVEMEPGTQLNGSYSPYARSRRPPGPKGGCGQR
jgi:predicted nucleotidyltransferase